MFLKLDRSDYGRGENTEEECQKRRPMGSVFEDGITALYFSFFLLHFESLHHMDVYHFLTRSIF